MADDIRKQRLQPEDLERALAAELELVDANGLAVFAWPEVGAAGCGAAIELSGSLATWADLPLLCDLVAETLGEQLAVTSLTVWLLEEGALPRSGGGSIDRQRCRAQLCAGELRFLGHWHDGTFERGEATSSEPAAGSALVGELAGLAADVLGLVQVDPDDNLFARGADSIACVRLALRVRERWGVKLEPRAMFDAPRLRELAAHIEEELAHGHAAHLETISRVARDRSWPLSAAQLRLWLVAQLEGTSPAQHVVGGVRLLGALDGEALLAAARRLAQRHEVLRTTFERDAGQPVQRLWAELPVVLETSRLPASEAEPAAWPAYVRRAANVAFDLERGPLWRLELRSFGDHDHLLVLCMHHVISDGWSMELAMRELLQLYAAELGRAEHALPELPCQFVDYASWEASCFSAAKVAEQLGYWRERLGRDHTPLELPKQRARGERTSVAGPTVVLELAAPLTNSLRALAESEGSTLFAVLLAGFQLWLARMVGRDDVRVGVPVLGRQRREAESLIGCFVNTLVIAVGIERARDGRALVRQVDEALRGAQAHAELPFERLVKELAPERSAQHNPLFQVTFNHLHTSQTALREGAARAGLQLQRIAREPAGSPFELSLETEEDDAGQVRALFVYPDDLFEPKTVRGFAQGWQAVLEQLAAQPTRRVGDLELLPRAELTRLSAPQLGAAGRELVQGVTAHELVLAHATRTPAAIALVGAGERLSYAQLERYSRVLAQRLRERGVGPEVRVGVSVARGPGMIVAALAIWRAGGVYVPLDPQYPPARAAYIARDAELLLVICDEPASLALEAVPQLSLATAYVADAEPVPPLTAAAVHPEQLAYVIYTSGSTGQPKGVAVAHGALAMHCQAVGAIYEMTPRDCVLHFSSFTFDAAVENWTLALAHGARLVLSPSEPWTGEQIYAAVQREGVNIILPPTVHLRLVAQYALAEQRPLALRVCCVGGEAVSREDHALITRGLAPERFINGYGPTEAVITPLLWRGGPGVAPETSYVPIGHAVGERRVYVLDVDLMPVAAGVIGEIYLAGMGLARGYQSRSALTAAQFIPDPFSGVPGSRMYRSGDFGRWLDTGDVEYVGRRDDQVKVRGFRIELGEIESELRAQPEVREVVVVAVPERGSHRLVAYAVAARGMELVDTQQLTAAVREALSRRLPAHMLPSAWVWLPALPLTAHGKVDKRALPVPRSEQRAYRAPQTSNEQALARVWSSLLGVADVGLDDNFFELGGDSIVALQMVGRARQEGLSLAPRSVFEHQTLRALSASARTLSVPALALAADAADQAGRWALTPIARSFFEALPPHPEHYNQSVLLGLRRSISPAVLSAAVASVAARHPALRLAARRVAETWELECHEAVAERVWVECHAAESEAQVFACIEAAQRSLTLEAGQLLRAVLIQSEARSRLLLVVHHLAVDGVSYRILLEDLALACDAWARGVDPQLPAASLAMGQWAARLESWAGTPELLGQLAYWREQAGAEAAALLGAGQVCDRLAECEELVCVVDAPRCTRLLREAGRAYRMRADELLLSALVCAVERWNGQRSFSVLLEGHGRQSPWPELDLSRSVGWFTCAYPVALRAEAELGATMRGVKEHLRSVPDAGLGYGVLRYMAKPDARQALRALPAPTITFNYLGQFEQAFAAAHSPFELLSMEPGSSVDPESPATSPIVIDAWVVGGELTLRWRVSPTALPRAAAQQLVGLFEAALDEVIEHGVRAPFALTPSDLPHVRLEQSQLDALPVPAESIENIYPVSPLQHGMLFHAVTEPNAEAYFNQLAFDLHGASVSSLETAFRNAADRHEALRSGFLWQAEPGPLQLVLRRAELRVTHADLRAVADPDAGCEAARLAERAQRFELASPPLLRIQLVRLPGERVRVIWTCHHLALDGWSTARILAEVLADVHGAPGPAVALEASHAQVLAFRAERNGPASEAFWRARVRELEEPTLLTAALAAVPDATTHAPLAARYTPSEYAELRASAQALRVTTNTLVQAAWLLVLSRLTRQAVVSCGVTVSGRPPELPGSEALVGMYIQTLPLIHRVEAAEPLPLWLARLMLENQALREHDQCALPDIQRWAALPGRALFDSLIVFENYPIDEALRGQDARYAPSGLQVFEETNYAFTLTVQLGQGDLQLALAYPCELVSRAAAAQLMVQFRSVLEQLTGESAARHVGDLILSQPGELAQLDAWNATARPLPASVFVNECIRERAARSPEATALVFAGERRSYRELDLRTNRLANRLRALGVGPDVRVAVLAERSFELVEALVATLKAGGAYVPLDPELPDERIAVMLHDTGARVLLTQRAQLARTELHAALPEASLRVVLDADDWLSESSEAQAAALQPDNLAYVIYTSGSTGVPKGAANTQRGLFNRLAWMQDCFGLGPDDVVLQKTPYAFDVSVWEFFWPLMTGSTLVVAAPGEHRDPERIAQLVRETGVTTLHFVPSMLQAFLAHADVRGCSSLRRVICSGEALSAGSVEKARELMPWAVLHNLYGPTEAAIDVTHWACESLAPSVPIGRPIWNTAVYVLDAHLQRAPLGAVGELYLAGLGLARGYHTRASLTADRFVPDPWGAAGSRMYRTGDLGRVRADGAIEYLGRSDQQLKLRGFRIEPAEIEAVLRAHPEVRDAVVVARADTGAGATRLVGYVAAQPAERARLSYELDGRLRARLPEYMVPAQLVVLPTLPLTPSGKLDRRALPAPELAPRGRAEPESALEATLLALFREVLKAPHSGVMDDFFELGGDSLVCLQLIARARRAGLELTAKQVFEARSVAKLAELMSDAGAVANASDMQPIERAARDEWMALSFAQERLWFLAQLEPDSPAYNISGALRLRGMLDVARLRAAFEELVRRHEALRTSFEERQERGMQCVHAHAVPVLREQDVQGPEAQRLARAHFARETLTPFTLKTPSLLRLLLLKLAADEHVLVVTLHHLIADAETIALLVRDLVSVYDAGTEQSPVASPLAYVDYAAWQRATLNSATLAQQLGYWRGQLGAEHPVLELPLDRPRPPSQSYRGAVVTFTLDAQTSAAVARIGIASGASAFMVLLAGFECLLYRLTGQRDLRVGIPASNRSRVELEGIAGLFVNTLVLRTQLDGSLTFSELLARVKESVLGAQAHRDLPFEQLVEALSPERSLSHNPLFQVMFDHQRSPLARLPRMAALEVTPFESDERATQLDLGLEMIDDGAALRGSFTYATDLFDRNSIEALAERYQRLLAQALHEPSLRVRVSELDVLDQHERQTLLEHASSVQPGPHLREPFVQHRISAQASAQPEAVALLAEDGTALSYAELERRSNQWARYLQRQGVGPEVKVGLCVGRSPRMVLGALAIMKAGGAYVPLDPSYPHERLRAIMTGAGVRLLVSERALPLAAELAAEQYVWLDTDDASGELASPPEAALHGHNLAYVVYTSGSTGKPKGVGVSHAALARHIAAIGADYGMRDDDCSLHFASMSFDAGVEQWASPLAHGARLLIRGDELWTAERALELLREHRVSWFEMPPGYLREVAEAALERGETLHLRACTAGGEAVSREALGVILRAIAPAPLVNGYGPTEAVITPMTWHVRELAQCTTAYAPIGRVVGPRRGYVLDADLNLAPPGVTGELYLGGSSVARGYLDQPGLTAERFVPDPWGETGSRMYRTGDLVRVAADGAVEYLGRADHQVKVRGFRVELGEIEAQLLAQPGVREAVVVAQGGAVASRLVGYIAGDADPASVLAQLRAALPEYMVPAQLVVLAALPRNENGKVDRKRLPLPELSARAYVAPGSGVERCLCAILREVLRVERVGITDNFFELGGDSIRSLQVISRARKHGLSLRPRDLFEHQDVAALAKVAVALVEQGPELVALPRDTDVFKLSYAQERLWFLAQLEPESAAYNIAGAVRVYGALDIAALQGALDVLIARHESLRTTFEAHDGQPRQRIHARLALRLHVRELTAADGRSADEQARAHVEAEAHALFDLAQGPLLRVSVLCVSPSEQVLSLVMHHIISDGWSLDVAISELSELYVQSRGPGTSALPELPLQYVDYAAWQRSYLGGQDLTRQVEYWKGQLGSEHPVLALPTDQPRPTLPTHRGGVVSFVLEDALGERLRQFAREHDTTPFVVLLTLWQTLLYRLTGQRDIRVGVPVTNRDRLETERVIGFFVNTVVLRSELEVSRSFEQQLARCREAVLAAQAHQDIPFERLVELLQPARSMGHNPLFQVMYNHLRREDLLFAQTPELRVAPFEWQSQIAQFDLCLDSEEDTNGHFSGRLTYATDLFEHASAERWVRQLVRGLEVTLAQPGVALGALPWLDSAERSALLAAAGAREQLETSALLHERISAQAQRRRAHTACSYESERLSYGALELRANQWAQRLRKLGVGPDVLVGLCVERSLDLVVGIVAILKAGGAYLPLDPAAPADRLSYMIDDSRVSVVLTQAELAARLPRTAALRVLCMDREDVRDEPSTPPATETLPDHLAYVIYTSGSTGKPKGALLSHRNVTRLFDATQRWFAFDERDVWSLFHSYAFDFSVWELFGALLYGGSVVIVPYDVSRSPSDFHALLVREGVTILNQTPSAFKQLSAVACAAPASERLALRRVVFGGEALEVETLRPWFERFGDTQPQLINMYGITETTVHVTYRPLSRSDLARAASSPIGEPIADLSLYVLDDALEPCGWGVTGELYVGGEGLAHGYLGRPALTAERFLPNPFGPGRLYRSGDLASRRTADSRSLEYLGRSDHQVKIRGFRIELGEIAAQLQAHPLVREAAVIARRGPSGQRLLGYVTLQADQPSDAVDTLKAHLRRALPEYMVPATLIVLVELPLTVNGKLDRDRLPEQAERADAFVAPSTPLERQLAEIWAELLGVPRVGVHDDFFVLGGHSLLVTQVMSRVQQQLGVTLPLRNLFEATTLQAFAERVAAASSTRSTESKLDALDALLSDLENEP